MGPARAIIRPVVEDPERCYRAVRSRDARFDGWFVFAVTSTGIYCRPSCPAVPARRENMRFYATAAAAQVAGFRACLRCRPDAAPGSPEWNAAGRRRRPRDAADRRRGGRPRGRRRAGRAGWATASGTSTGCSRTSSAPGRSRWRGPSAPRRPGSSSRPPAWRSRRSPTRPASGACASSTRRSTRPTRRPPRELRARARARGPAPGGPRRAGAAPAGTAALPRRAAAGVPGRPGGPRGRGGRRRALPPVAAPAAGGRHRGGAPGRRRRAVPAEPRRPARPGDGRRAVPPAARPGRRPPGRRRPAGERPGARRRSSRRARACACPARSTGRSSRCGRSSASRCPWPGPGPSPPGWPSSSASPCPEPDGGVTRLFPAPEAIAEAGDLPMPRARAGALRGLAAALAAGRLVVDPGEDREAVRRGLLALPGVGPWTASYVAMRGLADPDVMLRGGRRRAARARRPRAGRRRAGRPSAGAPGGRTRCSICGRRVPSIRMARELEEYRRKRDPAATPEPFPGGERRGRRRRSSSSSATRRAGCTTTSGSSATARWPAGPCPRGSRSAPGTRRWRFTSRTTRSSTGRSRARSRRASTAPARSRSGTRAPTSWSRTSPTAA